MSCANVDGFGKGSGRLQGTMRSLLGDSNWFHNSLQHLQQWQGWQHFRNKPNGDKFANDRSTWYVGPNANVAQFTVIARHISEDSLDFFDKFATIRERADRPRRRELSSLVGVDDDDINQQILKGSAAKVIPADDKAPQPAPRSRPRSRLGLPKSSSSLSVASIWGPDLLIGKEAENVYVEVLYSLIHAISRSDRVPSSVEDVFIYLRRAFQIGEIKHRELLDAVQQRTPPDFSLHLGVLQARNLKGKDVNGLSDPYCSVWISSNRQKLLNTPMKPKTLDPVWNEQLQFLIKDISEDLLQIEIWDFDPNETFKEKISRLGEVKNCRGFGKLLKQIAVASGKAPGKQPHQFLGRVNVPLKMVPLSGLERWFSVEGRDKTKIKERGEIKLNLSVSASRAETQFTLKQSFIQYERILRAVLECELRSDPEWRGEMPETAVVALRQFAAHRSLRPPVTDVCLWSAYTMTLSRRTLDFCLLYGLLQRIRKAIHSDQFTVQVDQLSVIFWTSSETFVRDALSYIRHIRDNLHLCSSPAHLTALLQCLKELRAMGDELGKPNFADLPARINEAITMGAADWWSQTVGRRKIGGPICDDDRLENAIRICQSLMTDLKAQLTLHHDVFLKVLETPSFSIVYQYYDAQLSSLCKPTVESVTRTLKSSHTSEEHIISLAMEASGAMARHKASETETDASGNKILVPKLTMGTALFELYLSLQQFQKLSAALPPLEKEKLNLNRFYVWFATAVCRWLDIALYKAMIRIGKAISLDSLQTVDCLVKFSSSAVDTVTVFYQIKTFWDQLAWPDTEGALTFVIKIIDDVNRCSSFYADALSCKLERLNATPSTDVFYITPPVCAAIHSILHVRKSIEPLAEEMGLSNLCRALQENNNEAGLVSAKTKETLTQNAVDNINAKLDEIFYTIARKIEAQVAKLMSMVSDSGFGANQRARLMSYIDDHLITLNTQLDLATFDRVLHLIHQRIMHSFYSAITIDIEKKKSPGVFQQWVELLKIINECFYGPSIDEKISDEMLPKIQSLLKLHGSASHQLIHNYQLERMKTSAEDCGLGSVTVRALFVNESLTLDILNARNLKPTDSGASADPYLKVQLMPSDKFPDSTGLKSKVHKNTLFPLFEETFSSSVARELQTTPDCFILLTLKDRDLIGTNELMGEAFLSFQHIPRGDSVSAIKSMDQLHLYLSKPSNKESEYLHILEGRSWDRVAKDFAKRERKRMNVK